MNNRGYIKVTETVPADGITPVSDGIQKIIDENPNRTIFFPDGVYLLDKPIQTPADPKRSVCLELSGYAVLRAADGWAHDEAMVRLGATYPANDTVTVGSNYSFKGGVIDGNGVADGISIDGGRETLVQNVSIKHTRIGLRIKYGANCGSSDADIFGVNIMGNGEKDSVGVLLEGFDNSLTNMRIADVYTGVWMKSAGNVMKNLHPLFTIDYEDYENSCGFKDEGGNNWYNFCYSDHFGTGFYFAEGKQSILDACYALWYCDRGDVHTAVKSEGKFDSVFSNFKIDFKFDKPKNVVLAAGKDGGKGVFDRLLYDSEYATDNSHLPYVKQ
ncbi:MAG: hypothetical protein E7597_02800 [Ruminococcaceae bacterium]|nr:hypothetical protein [Oscillospiraceae bacterium]